MDIPKPTPTDHKPVPTRTDAHAETTKLDNGFGADRPARRVDADAVTIGPPRVAETITQTGPRAQLPAQRLLVTGTHPVIHDGAHLQLALLDLTQLDLPMPGVGECREGLGPLAGIIDRCLIKDRAHRTRDAHVLLQELEAIPAGRRGAVLGHDGNPFAGLAPFQEADADRFYGRAREVGAVLARLRSCPLIALAGPSGVGKSSLVRAGVIPQLKRSGEGWDTLTFRPGRSPLASLAAILIELARSATDPVATASGGFSPDGTRVVTASADQTARVWDAATGKPLTPPLKHQREVNNAAFSPDGTRVVTASYDQTARVWDAATGKPLTPPLKHQGEVNSAAFSPDGTRVVTASNDKTARVWDAATGKPLAPALAHRGEVNSAAFSPDGIRVVTASFDHTARVWDAATGKPLPPFAHQERVWSAAFSPDGTRVVIMGVDNTAQVWDVATGKPLGQAGRVAHDTRSTRRASRLLAVSTACCQMLRRDRLPGRSRTPRAGSPGATRGR